MNDNKYDFLNRLTELDDYEIEKISEDFPFADKSAKKRIAKLCEEKLDMNNNKDEFITDRKADKITKTPWYRSYALGIAASLILVAGFGFLAIKGLSRQGTKDNQPENNDFYTGIVTETTSVTDTITTTASTTDEITSQTTTSTKTEISTTDTTEITVSSTTAPTTTTTAKKAAVHYSITLPSDANGKFIITFNAYRDGNFTAFKSKEITFPYDQNFDETITGEGTEKVYVMLENAITWDSGIIIGNYVFDYDSGNITTEYEDVRKAFEDAGAFRDYTQSDFKRQSVNEFMSMLNGIRGIQDDKTWLIIAEQSVSLLNWSMGTTLTNDEIISAWGIYTDNWTEADFDSFRHLYQLVYDEAFNIVTNGNGELLAQLGYSDSDFNFVELPLEPMETIKALT
ncbi:MAG: hypothetical protein IKK47_07870 [Ruminococcus sp.]|nr:hypothetical protein [Ruminococcus sp.]